MERLIFSITSKKKYHILCFFVLCLVANGIFCIEPELIKDINTNTEMIGYSPKHLTNLNNITFFNAYLLGYINSLPLYSSIWKLDENLIDAYPLFSLPKGKGFANIIGATSNHLYFFMQQYPQSPLNAEKSLLLMKSDGTIPGTHVIKRFNCAYSLVTNQLSAELNGRLIFNANVVGYGDEMWVTDGTESGTFMLKDIYPNENSSLSKTFNMIKYKDNVYFYAQDSLNSTGVWRTDGTKEGTNLFKNCPIQDDKIYSPFAIINDKLFISSFSSSAFFIITDGTDENTYELPVSGWNVRIISSYKNKLYYNAYDKFPIGFFSTDGTTNGTEMLFDKGTFDFGKEINGKLVLFGKISTGKNGLYVSDGSTSGTSLIQEIYYGYEMIKHNGKVYLLASKDNQNKQLWESDGTPEGTKKIYQFSFNQYPESLTSAGNKVLFIMNLSAINTPGIHILDPATKELSSVTIHKNQTWSSNPKFITPLSENFVFFGTKNDTKTYLFTSDGTDSGTYEIADMLQYTSEGESLLAVNSLQKINDSFYFITRTNQKQYVWKTDGSKENTGILNFNSFLWSNLDEQQTAEFKDKLWFITKSKNEIWKTDGTESGTQQIFSSPDNGALSNIFPTEKFLFFSDFFNPYIKIYSNDGSSTGTKAILTISNTSTEYFGDNSVKMLGSIDNDCIFAAATDYSSYNDKVYFYKTDGTIEGTENFLTLDFGAISGFVCDAPKDVTVADDFIYFTLITPSSGYELWRTNGSLSGTFRLKTLSIGEEGSYFYNMSTIENQLFFTIYSKESGWELWKSDGTEEGTKIFKDIATGKIGGVPEKIKIINSNKYFCFSAFTPNVGEELWISDGTPNTAFPITDLLKGLESSSPQNLTIYKDYLIFTAWSDKTGIELWKIPIASLFHWSQSWLLY